MRVNSELNFLNDQFLVFCGNIRFLRFPKIKKVVLKKMSVCIYVVDTIGVMVWAQR